MRHPAALSSKNDSKTSSTRGPKRLQVLLQAQPCMTMLTAAFYTVENVSMHMYYALHEYKSLIITFVGRSPILYLFLTLRQGGR